MLVSNELRVSVRGLTKGMYVARLDRPWLDTPFPLEGLMLESPEEIEKLQRICSYVYVDTARGKSPDLRYVALAVTVAAGLLMVSRIRYSSFKGSGSGPKSDRVPFFALLIVVVVLIALAIDAPKTLLAATVLYALSGPLLWFRRRKPPQDTAA